MNSMTKVGAALIVGMTAFGSIAPAYAQAESILSSTEDSNNNRQQRDRYVQRFCDGNPRDRDCGDWRNNRGNWDDQRYQQWYGRHNNSFGGDAVAAGIFGLAIGAIVNGAINNNSGRNLGSSHVQRCEARYQSYDRRSDTFLGYDGRRHDCNL